MKEKSYIPTTKKRQLNFECLRIVCMILIVLHHYTLHGGLIQVNQIGINKFIAEFINIGGKLGAITFILITGYFMIDSKFKMKKMLKIIFEVVFYSAGITTLLICTNQIEFSMKNLIKSILPISFNQYWFITFYVGIYLLSPVINRLANTMNQRQYKNLLILGAIALVIIPTVLISAELFYNGFLYFMYLYLVGGYIKRYNIELTMKKINIAIWLILIFMMIVSIGCTYLSQTIEIAKSGITYLHKANSIPIFALSVFIFLWFKNIQLKDNKIIEILSKTSLSVYLISDHPYLRMILWRNFFKTENVWNVNAGVLIAHIMVCLIGIYLICTCIDMIRIELLEKSIFKIKKIDTILEKTDKIINLE